MSFARLLAKGSRSPDQPAPAETLAGHLTEVVRVARVVATERRSQVLGALGLDEVLWGPRLEMTIARAALAHDLGKASEHFQQMVRRQTRLPQALKHEVVSLWLILAFPELDRWLFAGLDDSGRYAALRAVAGHHLRFDPGEALKPAAAGTVELRVLAGHQDFTNALEMAGRVLNLGMPPRLANRAISLGGGDLTRVADLVWDLAAWWEGAAPEAHRFAAAVAALLIAADVGGSVLVRTGVEPARWAGEALETVCTGPDLAAAASRRLDGKPLRRPFQPAVADSPTRLTLVTAGCGSGKTVAAYLWAGQRLDGRKLCFCYPTTGTATEGFQDYAFPEFEGDAALVHSRAELDIERILDNGPEEGGSASLRRVLLYQGLHFWDAKVTVCTADAVLGLVQNNRVGLFAFPALAGAGFVFDEIHLYDDRMFGSLLAFLEAARGVPVLLMTATLPPARVAALQELAQRLGERLNEISGPRDLEELPRYQIAGARRDEAFEHAVHQAAPGGRVLWVANTVDRAVAVGIEAGRRGIRVEPYHSRYRYVDRLARHRAVVDLFKSKASGQGVLAVTTQVCEVSLDISADLLVTELAPPPSLIQRLGRLNRWATPEETPGPLPALVVEPENHWPYPPEELAMGRDWLSRVAGGPRSQRDLHKAFGAVLADRQPAGRTRAAWLDEAWTLEPQSLREAGVTFTVLLEEDRERCLDRRGRPIAKDVTRHGIPMLWGPVAKEAGQWPQVGGALVAPRGRIDYSETWGAQWRK